MSDIKVGDLVRIAYKTPCCGKEIDAHGLIFVVSAIKKSPMPVQCNYCGARVGLVFFAWGSSDRRGTAILLLRKIDPLSEPETVETEAVA